MIIVLFATELRPDADLADYQASSRRMNELVRQIPGFISVKGYTAADSDEVVIARFESEEALDAWRFHPEHVATQRNGGGRTWPTRPSGRPAGPWAVGRPRGATSR